MRKAARSFAAFARPFGAAVLFATLACTGGKAAVKPDAPEAPQASSNKASSANAKTPAPAPKKEQMPDISNRALVLFEDAHKAYETQKRSGAVDYISLEKRFQAALDADPKLAEAEFNIGVLAERQGKLDEAQKRYRSALERKPSLKEAAINLAVLAQNRGDTPGAIAMYQKVLAAHPRDALSRAHLAEIFRQSGDHEKALELARQALMRDPKAVPAYKVMLLSYLDRKQLALAKLVALRAVKLDENDPDLYFAIGQVLMQENEVLKAKLQFERAVAARADYLPARVELAKLALKEENYQAAEEHLRRILQADGKNAAAHLDLGVAYKGMGKFDKAMQEYDEAEKLDPKLAAIYLNRGIILLRFKDAPERAQELFKRYLSLSDGLNGESSVLNLMKEAEAIVQAKADAKRMEEEAKKLEAAQKAQQEKLKAADAAEAKNAPPDGKSATPAKAGGAPAKSPEPASGQAPQKPAAKPSGGDEPTDDL
ncbi:MAG TPA: adventurous gliding motility TPR repeat lipoprotein GltE [Myxococcaceae bacterium]|nr:adventurous gliding motility TPR repeat lipoprotein GltE [Myxococcaceae bacterium]